MHLRWLLLPLLLCLMGAGPEEPLPRAGEFQGQWSVTGEEQTMDFLDGRQVSIVRHRGMVNLEKSGGLPRAFFSYCLGFRDTKTSTARCEWVDSRDERLFIETTRALMGMDDLVTARIVGGTGRYAGIRGEIELRVWIYSAPNKEEGQVQAYSDSLRGSWSFP